MHSLFLQTANVPPVTVVKRIRMMFGNVNHVHGSSKCIALQIRLPEDVANPNVGDQGDDEDQFDLVCITFLFRNETP
ncbi:hypothetical protein Aduo_008679 [Ancylostoma duodenale]